MFQYFIRAKFLENKFFDPWTHTPLQILWLFENLSKRY